MCGVYTSPLHESINSSYMCSSSWGWLKESCGEKTKIVVIFTGKKFYIFGMIPDSSRNISDSTQKHFSFMKEMRKVQMIYLSISEVVVKYTSP
jgi:hypothetical protein